MKTKITNFHFLGMDQNKNYFNFQLYTPWRILYYANELFFNWSNNGKLKELKTDHVMVSKCKKMSESQTKAGNQRKFENLKIFENLKNLKF